MVWKLQGINILPQQKMFALQRIPEWKTDFAKFLVQKALASSVPQESVKLISKVNYTCKTKSSCPRPSTTAESIVAVDPTNPSSSTQSAAILEVIPKKKALVGDEKHYKQYL